MLPDNPDSLSPIPPDELKTFPTQQIVTSAPPESSAAPPPEKKKIGLKLIAPAIAGLLLLLFGTGVSAYFVATEKIKLDNPDLVNAISSIVFKLPIIPKTPKYILLSSIEAHSQLQKGSFDLSFAAQSGDLPSILGISQLDGQIKGYTDLSDSQNPKFSLGIDITKEFSAQVRKKDKTMYFKINKLPLALVAVAGINPELLSPVTDNWISYDTSSLETEARNTLEKMEKPTTETDANMIRTYEKILNEEILPYIKVISDKLDNQPVYKLEYYPTSEVLDRIIEQTDIPKPQPGQPKISEVVKDIKLDLYIDQKDYYLRKATLTFILDPTNPELTTDLQATPLPVSFKSPVTVSFALLMSDFGTDVPIELPSDSVTPEEIYKQIMGDSGLFFGTNGMIPVSTPEAELGE